MKGWDAVPSLMEALAIKEAAARGRVEELRGLLEAAEAEVSRLVITRETVDEVLAAPAASALPKAVAAMEMTEGVAMAGLARAAALLVAAEQRGDATVTSPAYRQVVAVFAGKDAPLRCKEVLAGLGTAQPSPSQVETMRSKLNRLADRGILARSGAGLFELAGTGAR